MHIREFQGLMRRTYFNRDSKRGIERTHKWLVDEVEELRQALNGNDRNELEGEFADVIAWLTSLANIVDVDLEKATMNKYDNKCPKCKHSPCRCSF